MAATYGIGDIVSKRTIGGFDIEQTVVRVAYARNGNAHNPTVYYRWHLKRCGRPLDSFRTLRDAKLAATSKLY